MRPLTWKSASWLGLFFLLGNSPPVLARSGGIASAGCDGCHGGTAASGVTVSASPTSVAPGGQTTLTVSIPSSGNGGFFLRTTGPGALSLPGGGLRLLSPTEVVHSTPKTASGGKVTYQVTFTAPSTPGGVNVEVWAVAGNANGSSSGDASSTGFLSFAWGCAGTTYYRDFDGDGVGTVSSGTTQNCSAPAGYSAQGNDCDDNDDQVKPGNSERCNKKDDDCNGQVDEGLAVTTFYPDTDQDGYGVPGATTIAQGCTPPLGYAPNADDCDDANALRNPGKTEVCNGYDDDCDGKVDEGVKPTCGIGMCRREAPACRADLCTPAQPGTERCNGVDDDCDGETDEGDNLCGADKACALGLCVDAFADSNSPSSGTAPEPTTGGSGNTRPSSSSSSSSPSGCMHGSGGATIQGALLTLLILLGFNRRASGRRRARGR